MKFTYDGSLPTAKDEVRLKIGDTDQTCPEFGDDEINAILSKSGNDVLQAAMQLARTLAFKYMKLASSKKAGPYSEDTTQRAKMYMDMAKMITEEADEPWEEIAEMTHGDPGNPFMSPDEQGFLDRESRRGLY